MILRNLKNSLYVLLILSMAGFAPGAFAQQADDEEDENSEGEGVLEEVVTTGTRSRPRTVLDSTVPIDSFNADMLSLQSHGDMTENLKNLVPSFTATPLTGDGSAFIRSTSLRGLPPDDVLLLLNSKRRHRSAQIQQFGAAMSSGAHAADMGPIPAIALKRVEVLRDGAASQYGSDAIAGVINFMLKDSAEGGELEAQVGHFYEGEETYKVAGNIGLPLGSNGFINLSGEWTDNEQLIRGFNRPAAEELIRQGVPNVGIDSPYDNDPTVQTWGRPENDGFRTAWNAGIDLGNGQEVYMFGNWAQVRGNYRFFWRPPGHSTLQPVPLDPNDPSQGNFCFCDSLPGGYTPWLIGRNNDFSTTAGVRGEFSNGTNYDFSFGYGHNEMKFTLYNTISLTYGPNGFRTFETGDWEESDINVNADFSVPIRDNINFAYGFEYREETFDIIPGQAEAWQPGPWAGISRFINPETGMNYAEPPIGSNGREGFVLEGSGSFSRDNYAGYVDVEFDITDQFLLQTALRFEDFSDFGSTTNAKLAARYTVSDQLTLRGAISTGFRAPTPGQANVTTVVTTFDGVANRQTQQATLSPTDPVAVALGGKALEAEDALNISLGFSSNPTDNLTFTLDYYKVDVDDRIAKTQFLPVSGNPRYSTVSFYTNALETETSGVDIVALYDAAWNNGTNTSFSLAYNYNTTEVTAQNPVNGILPVSAGTIANIEENLPEHRAALTAVHYANDWTFTGRATYYGSSVDEQGSTPVGAEVFIDFEAAYQWSDNLRLIGGAANLFDTFPNEVPARQSQGLPYPRRSPMGYDGGSVYLRAVYSFD